MMEYIKVSGKKRKSKPVNMHGIGAAEEEISGMSKSTYLREEVSTFARVINNILKNEPALND